jgi:hypothetical protein
MTIETTSHLRATADVMHGTRQKEGWELQPPYFLTANVFAKMA